MNDVPQKDKPLPLVAGDAILVVQMHRGRLVIKVDVSAIPIDQLMGAKESRLIDHEGLVVEAGEGLSGGGELTDSIRLRFDPERLPEIEEAQPSAKVPVGDGQLSFFKFNEQLDHQKLSNRLPSEHVNHSEVEIVAGDGLSGGGDITTSRTVRLALQKLEKVNVIDTPVWIPIVDGDGLHGRVSLSDLAAALKEVE